MEGENGLKVYLAFFFFFFFFGGFLLRVFSLLRASGILYSLAWRRLLSSCPRFFSLFPGISATVSVHLITPTAVLKPGSASSSGVWHQIPVLSQWSLSWKLNSFFPISADEKGATSVFRDLANHSASFSFLRPVRRFIRTTICLYTPFFIHPVTECNISWLSFWPGCVTSAARNWPTFIIPLLTVSLWRPVYSNTVG